MKLSHVMLLTLASATPAQAESLCALVARLDGLVAAAGLPAGTPCASVGLGLRRQAPAQHSQAGAYFPDTAKIELVEDIDLASVYDQSFVLHELVHAAQYRAGLQSRVDCPAALEAQAYGIQADFLKDSGLEDEAMTIGLLAATLGSCGDPYG